MLLDIGDTPPMKIIDILIYLYTDILFYIMGYNIQYTIQYTILMGIYRYTPH